MSEWEFEVVKPSLQSIPYTLAISSIQSIPFGSDSELWRPCTQPQRWRSQAKYAPLFPPARWNLNGWSLPIASSDGPTPSTPAPDWVPKRHGSPWWPTSEFISRRHGSVVFQAPEIGCTNPSKSAANVGPTTERIVVLHLAEEQKQTWTHARYQGTAPNIKCNERPHYLEVKSVTKRHDHIRFWNGIPHPSKSLIQDDSRSFW